MKILFYVFALSFSSASFAADSWTFGSFFDSAFSFFDDIGWFFFEYIPSLFTRLYTYLLYYSLLVKVKLMQLSLDAAFSVATLVLSDMGFTSMLESLAQALPNDLRVFCVQVNIFKAINLVIEASIARFVLSYSLK